MPLDPTPLANAIQRLGDGLIRRFEVTCARARPAGMTSPA